MLRLAPAPYAAGLATPVVLWAGWPFFERGWLSVKNRSLNMFTLIAIGTGAAYSYSVIALLLPAAIPASFRTHEGGLAVYFEPAAVIVTLVLLGQVLELRARSHTSSAIKSLLGLVARTRLTMSQIDARIPEAHLLRRSIPTVATTFAATAMAIALVLRLLEETGRATLSSDNPGSTSADKGNS